MEPKHFLRAALTLIVGMSCASLTSSARPPQGSKLVRALRVDEMSTHQPVEFVLRLREFDELAERVNRGETMTVAELRQKYLPTQQAWEAVAAWARRRGYHVRADGAPYLSVRAEAPLRQVASDLGARFALVESAGKETVSAVDRVPVPTEITGHVLAIEGLRPPPQPKAQQARLATIPFPTDGTSVQLLNPHRLREAYNVPTGLDGDGQTIVIIGTGVKSSDLLEFWRRTGLPCTMDQVSEIFPYGPPTQPRNGDDYGASEYTKDLQVASAIAPKAKFLLIGADMRAVARVLIERAATDGTLGQLSISAGITERAFAADDNFLADTQQFAALAAIGISSFASSGDSGSGPTHGNEPLGGALGYVPSVPPSAEYPASDPFVTGVGGTTVKFQSTGAGSDRIFFNTIEGEYGWTLPSIPGLNVSGYGASGGGVSRYFARPLWQKGNGMPDTLARTVPDVAAVAESDPIVFGYYTQNSGRVEWGFSGTSMSAPVWAGLNALINQARRRASLPHVGLLNAHIYRLAGTAAFRQPTRGRDGDVPGTNGAYRLGPGYNMVTGLGAPDMGKLIEALTQAAAPTVAQQPTNQTTVAGGDATFEAHSVGHPLPSVRWTMDGVAMENGTLPDGTEVAGAATSVLKLSRIAAGQEGRVFAMIATNAAGSVASQAARMTVAAPVRKANAFADTLAAPAGFQALATLPSTAFRLQWFRDGVALPGATGVTYVATQPGSYAVTLGNGREVAVRASVAGFVWAARQVNLSARVPVQDGDSSAIMGFVLTGGSRKQVLLRAIGPSLASFGIAGAIGEPSLTLFRGETALVKATAWSTPLQTELSDIVVRRATPADMVTTGAFAISPQSTDSAFVAILPPGVYTASITSKTGPGIALAEAYDMSPKDPTTLANLSVRTHVGAGESAAFVGIVSEGTGTFLLRAIGPSLAEFGVDGSLAEPELTLRDSGQRIIAINRGWQAAPIRGEGAATATMRAATLSDMQRAGAFALGDTLDAAMVVTLPPGQYTAQISGRNGMIGVALIESYIMSP